MSNSRLIELAKAGNAQAIAQLINHQLQRRGITALASRQGTCLRLLLEAKIEPTQAAALAYLQQALTKLASPTIQQVEVYGRQQGTAKGWQSLLTLAQGEFEIFSGKDEGRSPRSTAPKSLSQSQPRSQAQDQPSDPPSAPPSIWPKIATIWLQWQGAAWASTLITSLIAAIGFGLVFLIIFSLFNRLSEAGVLLLTVTGLAVVFPLLGLLLGDAQTRVLRRWVRSIGGWRWFTMMGFMLGFLLTLCVHFLLDSTLAPLVLNPTTSFVIGQGIPFVATSIGLLFSLLCIALVQWLTIRLSVPRAYEWVLVSVFGGMLSWGLGMAASDRWVTPLVTSHSSYDFWSKLMVIGAGGLFSWLLFHAVSGLSMARLLYPLPRLPREE
ncbi:MAG: hypothetical protein HC771_05240 [Synechococcales cyanobacterium CRU_2_2]|nr:hypothetical protein [Synechococcales cyanobacterium CRU_2_2]